MTRIGLVGCGAWGQHILRDLRDLGAEVAVVTRSAATRARAIAGGASSVHERIADLPPADGYVVATNTGSHAAMIEALLPTGRPIFVEKPLTNHPAEAQSIAERAGDRVFSMDKWRYHAGVLKLAGVLASGHLGTIRHVQSWRLGWQSHDRDSDSTWHLLPHDLSIVLELLGHIPELRWATGFLGFGVHAEATAFLQDPGGPSVGISVSGCHPVNRRSVLIVGSEGSAQLAGSDDDRLRLRWSDGRTEELPFVTEMPLRAELQAFLVHLRGGPPPKSRASEAALVVRRIAEIRAMAGLDHP
jgi:predicted dehydrogenase